VLVCVVADVVEVSVAVIVASGVASVVVVPGAAVDGAGKQCIHLVATI